MAKEHSIKCKKLFILFVLALNIDKRLYQVYEECYILFKEGTIGALLSTCWPHFTNLHQPNWLNSDCHWRLIISFLEAGNFQHAQLSSMEKRKTWRFTWKGLNSQLPHYKGPQFCFTVYVSRDNAGDYPTKYPAELLDKKNTPAFLFSYRTISEMQSLTKSSLNLNLS